MAPAAAVGQETYPPCPAGTAPLTITVTDPGGAGALYATHVLRFKVTHPGGYVGIVSATAPGARVFIEPELNQQGLVTDRPGPLALSIAAVVTGPGDVTCTLTMTKVVQVSPAARFVFGDFKRPRFVFKRFYHRRPDFTFTVRPPGPNADRSALTVRARVSRRLGVPKASAAARTQTFLQREFEFPESDGEGPRCPLFCSKVANRGFHKSVSIYATPIRDRVTSGVKILVSAPVGIFRWSPRLRRDRLTKTPYGVDIEVLQSGRRIARLRVAAECHAVTQVSKCRFKTISTKL